MKDIPIVDALIIGGGPAGLTTALTLARQLHTCVVFDSKKYRNDGTPHMHTVITWDHKDPTDFRTAARKNILSSYKTVQFADLEVTGIQSTKDQNGNSLFTLVDEKGDTWVGRKLVLAMGVTDVLPPIDGYDECWRKGIFHCLFCHGYEQRQAASSGVLAIGDLGASKPALHFARSALQLTPQKVTIYTNGSQELEENLCSTIAEGKSTNIAVDSRKIVRLEKVLQGSEVVIHFEDGTTTTEGFLGHRPKTQLTGSYVHDLGLELTAQGDIKTTAPFLQTSVRGVFAAGDSVYPVKIVNHAMFTGAAAASGVAAQLQAEKWGHPVPF